jgi:putative transposase
MIFYRRNLPHFHPENQILFITYRLAGSVPAYLLNKLRKNLNEEMLILKKRFTCESLEKKKKDLRLKYFYKLDDIVDQNPNNIDYLSDERIATLVMNKFFEFDNLRYELYSFCVMPNHVHLVINNNVKFEISKSNKKGATKDLKVADTLRLIKGSTARNSNKILSRGGKFWQSESFDRVIRNKKELLNTLTYVIYNPVKAGLVNDWTDWKYTYLKEIFY